MSDLFDNATFTLPFRSDSSVRVSKKKQKKQKRSYIVERLHEKRGRVKKISSNSVLKIPNYII
jgi:hypothetical protein